MAVAAESWQVVRVDLRQNLMSPSIDKTPRCYLSRLNCRPSASCASASFAAVLFIAWKMVVIAGFFSHSRTNHQRWQRQGKKQLLYFDCRCRIPWRLPGLNCYNDIHWYHCCCCCCCCRRRSTNEAINRWPSTSGCGPTITKTTSPSWMCRQMFLVCWTGAGCSRTESDPAVFRQRYTSGYCWL